MLTLTLHEQNMTFQSPYAMLSLLSVGNSVDRRCDGEELVEHILRIILCFDLREPVIMFAKDIPRPFVILLHHTGQLEDPKWWYKPGELTS